MANKEYIKVQCETKNYSPFYEMIQREIMAAFMGLDPLNHFILEQFIEYGSYALCLALFVKLELIYNIPKINHNYQQDNLPSLVTSQEKTLENIAEARNTPKFKSKTPIELEQFFKTRFLKYLRIIKHQCTEKTSFPERPSKAQPKDQNGSIANVEQIVNDVVEVREQNIVQTGHQEPEKPIFIEKVEGIVSTLLISDDDDEIEIEETSKVEATTQHLIPEKTHKEVAEPAQEMFQEEVAIDETQKVETLPTQQEIPTQVVVEQSIPLKDEENVGEPEEESQSSNVEERESLPEHNFPEGTTQEVEPTKTMKSQKAEIENFEEASTQHVVVLEEQSNDEMKPQLVDENKKAQSCIEEQYSQTLSTGTIVKKVDAPIETSIPIESIEQSIAESHDPFSAAHPPVETMIDQNHVESLQNNNEFQVTFPNENQCDNAIQIENIPIIESNIKRLPQSNQYPISEEHSRENQNQSINTLCSTEDETNYLIPIILLIQTIAHIIFKVPTFSSMFLKSPTNNYLTQIISQNHITVSIILSLAATEIVYCIIHNYQGIIVAIQTEITLARDIVYHQNKFDNTVQT